jgi:hypothetical protein
MLQRNAKADITAGLTASARRGDCCQRKQRPQTSMTAHLPRRPQFGGGIQCAYIPSIVRSYHHEFRDGEGRSRPSPRECRLSRT